ncbi:hypothetical protein HDV04_000529 [Boothiomyces sp. JEL0838]|nr:hypothetical protein HDV04_000529 [Boothiomyces sp. JEL0838]
MKLEYRLVNVFCPEEKDLLQGNQLCVFVSPTPEELMQKIARQFNLSETSFVLDTDSDTKKVRIFTTSVELPFAGHPTLGSSFIIHKLFGKCDQIETKAGVIPISHRNDYFKFRANPATFEPETRNVESGVGIKLLETIWVHSGIRQLMARVDSKDTLFKAVSNISEMKRMGVNQILMYVIDGFKITSRFFFDEGHQIVEDPGTGSACACLGRLLQSKKMYGVYQLEQGHLVHRKCVVNIIVEEENVYVEGRVVEIGGGFIELP